MSVEDKNTLELISSITEFNDLHDYMQDESLDKALSIVVKLLMNPDVPAAKAPHLIIELQALSTKFGMLAAYYSTIAKDKDRKSTRLNSSHVSESRMPSSA